MDQNNSSNAGSLVKPTEGIVTLADANYYPGLETLYVSIQESYPVPVTCYDIGLSADQIRHAKENYANLKIVEVQSDLIISNIKRAFESASPLGKVGKRVWPLWICPFLIAKSPYQRVFWLDTDLVVLRGLQEFFSMLEVGPVFTAENNAPDKTQNNPELYNFLPIGRSFDPTKVAVNAGVSGWDLVRDRHLLEDYIKPVLAAIENISVRDAISWHDQGALIWAIHNCGLEGRILADTKWNLCIRNSLAFGKKYDWQPSVLPTLRTDEPDACLLHWNGFPVPWTN